MLKTYLKELREKALKAKDKPALLGPDIDLEPYMKTISDIKINDLEELPEEIKENILYSGITPSEEERAGTYFQINHSVVYEKLKETYKGKLEIMSIQEALEKYDWLEDYYGRLVKPDTDKYTAWAELTSYRRLFHKGICQSKGRISRAILLIHQRREYKPKCT